MNKYSGYGTTFFAGFTNYLGNDFEKNFRDVLDLGFNSIRLAVRWDWCEKVKGTYDFSIYNSLLDIAEERNIEVLLTLGVKAAGWPEYFYPEWFDIGLFMGEINVQKKYGTQTALLMNYIESAMTHFQEYNCIKAVQLENEPLVKYGKNNYSISEFLVVEEVQLVRKISNLPIVLTSPSIVPFISVWELFHLGNPVFKLCNKYADIIGIHVYPHVSMNFFGRKFIFKANWLDWLSFRWKLGSTKKPIWITEFQAEPWEPKDEVFSDDFNNPSYTHEDLKKYLRKVKNYQIKKIFLWAGEYLLSEKKFTQK